MNSLLSIVVVESSPRTKNHYLSRAVARGLRAISGVIVHEVDLMSALRLAPSAFDHLLVFGGEMANSVVIESLRLRAKTSSIWFTEDPYEFDANSAIADRFDLIFSNDKACASAYGSKAIHLPLAAEAVTPNEQAFAARRYDLSFVGSAWPNRIEQLKTISAPLKRIKTRIHLASNESLAPYLLKYNWEWTSGIDYLDFSRLASESRLALLLERDFSTAKLARTRSDTPGPRLFETAAAGAAVVVPSGTYQKFFEDAGLRAGIHFLSYSSPQVFDDLVTELVENPSNIEATGARLRDFVIKGQTYEARARKIVEMVRGLDQPRLQATEKDPAGRILFVTHNLGKLGGAGGSELYLDQALAVAPRSSLILARDPSSTGQTRYVLVDNHGLILEEFQIAGPENSEIRHPALEKIFASTLSKYKISHTFFNHLLGFPFSLGAVCFQLDVPYSIALHDYYLVCDSFNLLDDRGHYCGIDRADFSHCEICTVRRQRPPNFQPSRRDAATRFLRGASAIVTNAAWVSDVVQDALSMKVDQDRVHVIEPPFHSPVSGFPEHSDNLLRVAVVGNIRPNKGSDDLIHIARSLHGENIMFELFGPVDPEVLAGLRGAPHVVFHGSYDSSTFPFEQISRCQVALFLSKWPETHCIALTETMAMGLIPMCYDIGAFSYRVNSSFGYLLADREDVVRALRNAVRYPDELRLKASAIPPQKNEFAVRFEDLLASLRQAATSPVDAEHSFFPDGLFTTEKAWSSPRSVVRPPSHVVFGNYLREYGWRQTILHVFAYLRRRVAS